MMTENELDDLQHAARILIPKALDEIVALRSQLAEVGGAGIDARLQECAAECHELGVNLAVARRELAEAKDLLADTVVKATDYGVQDGDFVAMYLLPTGPIHRAIPWLDQHRINVRPGFDGRVTRTPSAQSTSEATS
jgi:hypothetical protein